MKLLNLTQEQKEVLIGNLLGDGHLTLLESKNANSRFQIGQKLSNSEYIDWLYGLYVPFSNWYHKGKYKNKNYGNEHFHHRMATCRHPIFTTYRKKWYINYNGKNRKIIPPDIILTWRIAAFWSLDDGCNHYAGRQFTLSTNGFTKKEVSLLIHCLKRDLNIISFLGKDGHGNYVIHVYSNNFERFIEGIAPYVEHIKCFNYKLRTRPSLTQSTTGHTGISFTNGFYMVRSTSNGERIYLGCFKTIEEAIAAKQKFNKNPSKYKRSKLRNDNTSGVSGVHYDKRKNKWILQEKIKGKQKHIGTFKTMEEANKFKNNR